MIPARSNRYSQVAADDVDVVGGETMEETLIAVPSSAVATSTVPMLQITAPADLPEGYEMDATLGDGENNTRMMKVTVPQGGVEKGQTFSVPLSSPLPQSAIHVPVGAWKDGFFDIFHHGVCHPHCWTACCCTTLAAGQVMSRTGLDWTGKPAQTPGRAAAAFCIIFSIVCVYYAVRVPLAVAFWIVVDDDERRDDDDERESNGKEAEEQEDEDGDGDFVSMLIVLWFCVFWVIMGVVLTRVRASVRERYGIPPSFLGEKLDDPVLSCCCCCFTAGQLLRHTTDYETYPAMCFTRTGHPQSLTLPSIV